MNIKPRQFFYNIPNSYMNIFKNVLSSNSFSFKNKLEVFLKKKFNSDDAIIISQNRIGLYLLLKALKKKTNKRKLIMSPFTISDIVNMVLIAGYTPIFTDVDPKTGNISFLEAKKKINKDVIGVLITHLHGINSNLKKFSNLCKNNNLYLIEDSAQSFGLRVDNKFTNYYSDFTIFSFGMAKNINGIYGGAILTNHKNISKCIRDELATWAEFSLKKLVSRSFFLMICHLVLSNWFFKYISFYLFRFGFRYNVKLINSLIKGEDLPECKTKLPQFYKSTITESQCRIILDQMNKFEQLNQIRNKYAKIYFNKLKKIKHIKIPDYNSEDIYLTYPILVKSRHKIINFFLNNKQDITSTHYNNLDEAECFSNYSNKCLNAKLVSNNLIYLPCYPNYGINNVNRNIHLLKKYFKEDS